MLVLAMYPPMEEVVAEGFTPIASVWIVVEAVERGGQFAAGDYAMTSMFVPDAVISLAVSPNFKEGAAQFHQSSAEVSQRRSHFPRKTGRRIKRNDHFWNG